MKKTRVEENKSMVKQRADDGPSWAQAHVGEWYWNGSNDFPVDKREALKWFELASEKTSSACIVPSTRLSQGRTG